jgi:hypothetical protein
MKKEYLHVPLVSNFEDSGRFTHLVARSQSPEYRLQGTPAARIAVVVGFSMNLSHIQIGFSAMEELI